MRIDRLVDIAFPRHLEKLEYQMRYVLVVLDRFSKSQSITKNIDLDTGENFGLKHEGRFGVKDRVKRTCLKILVAKNFHKTF